MSHPKDGFMCFWLYIIIKAGNRKIKDRKQWTRLNFKIKDMNEEHETKQT